MFRRALLLVVLAGVAPAASANADHYIFGDEGVGFFIGIDNRATTVGGIYDGKPNPNYNRLTWLLDHSASSSPHYHGIGTYSYTGPAGLPVVVDTNTNNAIPESFTLLPPIALHPGSGIYAGALRTVSDDGSLYSFLGSKSTASLAGFDEGTPGFDLYHSSSDRYTGSLAGIEVGLQLISYTYGLRVGNESVVNLFGAGDTISLGNGDAIDFKPVFSVLAGAPGGTYTAGFRLVNLTDGSSIMDSGRFYVNFAPVPEPETYALLGLGLMAVGFAVRRGRQGDGLRLGST
jgi:hypothetical protein